MPRRRPVVIINRTTEPLDVMYDGVPDVIPPGYKVVELEGGGEKVEPAGQDGKPLGYYVEYFAAEAFKRQHPRMGTQVPDSVDARDTEYLLGVAEWGDEVSHVEQTDADELIDRTLLPPHRQNAELIDFSTGAHNRPADRSKIRAKKASRKAKSKAKAAAQARRRQQFAADHPGPNPTGLQMSYDDQPR